MRCQLLSNSISPPKDSVEQVLHAFFKSTKHTTLLFYLLSPYLQSCMRGSRNIRKNMHIIKTIMKICVHWSTVCGMTNPDSGGIRTQFHQPCGQRMIFFSENFAHSRPAMSLSL